MYNMFKNIPSPWATFSGGRGIIARAFWQLFAAARIALQKLKRQGLNYCWSLAIICGCLGIFGLGFSTFSAQPDRRLGTLPPAPLGSVRRRKDGDGDPEPQDVEPAAGYARFSTEIQSCASNADQLRKCRECADLNGHSISPEFEFADEAVSGTLLVRKGLDAMLEAARARKFAVLYFHNLSRLARESVITMPMLKELVYVHKIRVISVTEGLDTARDGWEILATFLAIQHENYIKDLSHNVFRGQEGNVLAGLSVGDYCFGYASEPVPGGEQSRRGRNAKPQKVYVICVETAKWVVMIFDWFVYERRTPSWIARELNRLQAPKDHRAKTKHWTAEQVTALLRRRKYIGWWPWGERKNVRNPLTGQISREERSAEEVEKWLRHFPHLQLVDNETFDFAQRRLDENQEKCNASRKENGTFNGSRPGDAAGHPRHLLSCLIECASCGRKFYVGGSHGRYLFCPAHRCGLCDCATKLRRDRAERLILEAIGRRVLQNPAWRQAVLEFTQAAWQIQQRDLPGELRNAEAALAELDRKIGRLVDQIEDGLADPDIKARLAARRAERQKLAKEVEQLKRSSDQAKPAPTDAWIAEQLQKLGDVLSNGGPAAALALRNLVGGKIVVEQVELARRKRRCLRARFFISCRTILTSLNDNRAAANANSAPVVVDLSEEIVIDLVDPDPTDALAEEAKRLYDQNLMCKEIAQEMGIWPSQVTKLLKHWFQKHDQPLPDARTRRASLPRKNMEVHQYERVAEEAVALMQRGFSDAKIGQKLGCSAFVAGKAIKHWHRLQNLPTPTTRQRREARARLAKKLRDEGQAMKAIAKELECSEPTLCRLLDLAYELEGRERPDGRSQRKSSSDKGPPSDPSADSGSSAA